MPHTFIVSEFSKQTSHYVEADKLVVNSEDDTLSLYTGRTLVGHFKRCTWDCAYVEKQKPTQQRASLTAAAC